MKRIDFGGQKERDAGEGAGHPEQSPASVTVQPDNPRPVQVFQSCDPKIHTDASFRPGDGRVDGTTY